MTKSLPPTCQFLFQDACLKGKGLQDEVHRHYPLGECEKESVSSASPGPVGNDEVLSKLVVHPIHYDESTGQISPMAFNDAITIDASVFRESIATDEELQLAINEIKATGLKKQPDPQNRTIQLILQAKAEDLRAILMEGTNERLCMVYDTGSPAKPAHASIFTHPQARERKIVQRQVRRELHELFTRQQVPLADYRDLTF